MLDVPAPLALSQADFERFRDFFYRKTGIHFEDSKRYFIDRRLLLRIRASGHRDFQQYFTTLLTDAQAPDGELQQLINAMTVNETYFLREAHQLRCLVGPILDEVAQRRPADQPIRIWSIPTASGEEAYSLAIYLLEYWPQLATRDVEILASDIDTEMLARAQEGLYGERALQLVPDTLRSRYFSREAGGYRIDPTLRAAVAFSCVNITDPAAMQSWRDIDVVFCRNLLIYFDDLSRRRTAEALYDALRPGGFVCLGHAESMSRISSLFTIRKFADAIVYQKPC
ncbi:protein-glutamate O-methyltransferase CheR [Chitiniphilus purpureus]|uniref:protein-glutamate O-methyltransferase n=1 Tax=Chitiniphilus purpureus TaxID=2981137 RepID=A0ABY6DJD0_9NEIS|nr:protein-glutamate O-methyltransferase CheR [Chitiniphilus sp. CD1]UXY14147.1 protein-glutamate O-methyltransferase CheR [Chitiniphilus sp. CD1]